MALIYHHLHWFISGDMAERRDWQIFSIYQKSKSTLPKFFHSGNWNWCKYHCLINSYICVWITTGVSEPLIEPFVRLSLCVDVNACLWKIFWLSNNFMRQSSVISRETERERQRNTELLLLVRKAFKFCTTINRKQCDVILFNVTMD